MNLSSEARLKALVREYEFHGEKVHFRKLSVREWRALVRDREHRVPDENHEQDGFAWFAMMLSKQLCDAAGNLTDDSDEARAKLAELSPDEIAQLGQAALAWSGLAKEPEEAKKN